MHTQLHSDDEVAQSLFTLMLDLLFCTFCDDLLITYRPHSVLSIKVFGCIQQSAKKNNHLAGFLGQTAYYCVTVLSA